MPKPKTHAEHLAEYTLERLAEGLAASTSLQGEQLMSAQIADLVIALQRLMGGLVNSSYETRLIALLEAGQVVCPAGDDCLFGITSHSIATARLLEERYTAEVAA